MWNTPNYAFSTIPTALRDLLGIRVARVCPTLHQRPLTALDEYSIHLYRQLLDHVELICPLLYKTQHLALYDRQTLDTQARNVLNTIPSMKLDWLLPYT